jgi:hypothetical protein
VKVDGYSLKNCDRYFNQALFREPAASGEWSPVALGDAELGISSFTVCVSISSLQFSRNSRVSRIGDYDFSYCTPQISFEAQIRIGDVPITFINSDCCNSQHDERIVIRSLPISFDVASIHKMWYASFTDNGALGRISRVLMFQRMPFDEDSD